MRELSASAEGITVQYVYNLACSGSQSERRIRRILPAHGACHIINGHIPRRSQEMMSVSDSLWVSYFLYKEVGKSDTMNDR